MIYILFLLECCLIQAAEPIKIVVLDTGFKQNSYYSIPVCSGYHYDSTQDIFGSTSLVPIDEHGHGTHVVGVINQFILGLPLTKELPQQINLENLDKISKIKKDGYCFVIVKYFTKTNKIPILNSWVKALKHIETIPGKLIINISGGGSDSYEEEKVFVRKMLAKNNRIIAAIGNEYSNKLAYYPAKDYGVTAVGSMEITDKKKVDKSMLLSVVEFKNQTIYVYKNKYSNYGLSKILWRFGGLYSGGLNDDIVFMYGTSQATAMETGLTVKTMLEQNEESK
jgi:subtilisin family serine protease